MGVRILDGGSTGAALFCSTTDWAFGPVFENAEAAEWFLKWWDRNGNADPRTYSDAELETKYHEWFHQVYRDGNFFIGLAEKACAGGPDGK